VVANEYHMNVYDEEGQVIGKVRYNTDLDLLGGGRTGRHQGIAKLKNGRYVLIHGTERKGERDSAEVVTAEEALQAILKSGHDELLETKKFKELKRLYEKTVLEGEDFEKGY